MLLQVLFSIAKTFGNEIFTIVMQLKLQLILQYAINL